MLGITLQTYIHPCRQLSVYKKHGKRTLSYCRKSSNNAQKAKQDKRPHNHSHCPTSSPKSKPIHEFLSPAPSVGIIRGLSLTSPSPKLGMDRGLPTSTVGMTRGLWLRRMLVLLLDLERAKSLLDCERSRVCVSDRDKSRTIITRDECEDEDEDEARRCRMRCVGSTFGRLAIRAKKERTT